MNLTLVTAPTTEPFLLAEAKEHLRVFHGDDDTLITALIVSARQHCEAYTRRALSPQMWDQKADGFPCWRESLWVLKAPLLTSTAPVVTYIDQTGTSQTWSSSLYTVEAPAGPWARMGRIYPIYGESYPQTRAIENAVTVRYLCGYGTVSAPTVPEGIKAAMKLLIGHWYANREPVATGTIVTSIPLTVDALLWPFVSA